MQCMLQRDGAFILTRNWTPSRSGQRRDRQRQSHTRHHSLYQTITRHTAKVEMKPPEEVHTISLSLSHTPT